MKWFFPLLLISVPALGSGIIRIHGTLGSFTLSEYQIRTKKNVYVISRRMVSRYDKKFLKRPGKKVTVTVPFSAVTAVRPLRRR